MQFGSLTSSANTKNAIVLLLLIVQLGAAGLFYFYKYTPIQTQIAEKQKTVSDLKKQVREVEATKKQLDETIIEIGRLKAEIKRIEKFFPENVFVPRLLVLIENLALATHVDIETIKPKTSGKSERAKPKTASAAKTPAATPTPKSTTPGAAPKPNNPKLVFDQDKEYSTTDIDFSISGTFQNVYTFLNELATFPKLVVVNELEMSIDDSSSSDKQKIDEESQQKIEEKELGSQVTLSVKMPLSFYIQKAESPQLAF